MAKFFTPGKLSENIRETPEGFLFCLGVRIARTGWQTYGEGETPLECGPDGTVEVYRDAKEVFRAQTIASAQGKAVTIQHPEDFVIPENWKELAKGSLHNVRKGSEEDEDGEWPLMADVLITEAMAIGLVKAGLREVSCGYEAEYEQTGEGEGRQYNIIINHLALVEAGRAGQSYAINDHKGRILMSKKLGDKIKRMLGKVVDEATAGPVKKPVKDAKAKAAKGKTKDDDGEKKKDDKESKDAAAYDELVKMVKDLTEKVGALGGAKDEDSEEEDKSKDSDEEEGESEDADEEEGESEDDDEEASMEERLKALETAVSKLLESKDADEEEGESEDADEEEGESEDDEEEKEKGSMTGDNRARIEVLSPGLKVPKGKDGRKESLVAAFATKDGRAVIERVTGSKRLVLDSAEKINSIFFAASEVMKLSRGTGLEGTKKPAQFKDHSEGAVEEMTPEKMNEINAAHWGQKAGK